MAINTSSCQDLSRILTKIWASNYDTPVKTVLAEALEVEPNTEENLIDSILHFFTLINDVKEDVESLFEDKRSKKFIAAIRKVEKTFIRAQLLDATWKNTVNLGSVTDETLDIIEFCGDSISDIKGGKVRLTAEVLDKLRKQISENLIEIIESNLDKETKEALISGLKKLEDIIIHYKIRGSTGLEKTSNEVAGKFLLMLFKGPKELAKKHINDALGLVIGSIIMGALGVGFSALPESVQNFLPEVRENIEGRSDDSNQEKD